MRKLVGTVQTGYGDFARWLTLLHDHYKRKTGLDLYPGTLNLQLNEPYDFPTSAVRLEASEYGGRVSVAMIRCRIGGYPGWLLRPDAIARGDHERLKSVIEVAAEVKLRDVLQLSDGDTVTVEVEDAAT